MGESLVTELDSGSWWLLGHDYLVAVIEHIGMISINLITNAIPPESLSSMMLKLLILNSLFSFLCSDIGNTSRS